ncbi:hypothetical protein LCGC14_0943530 [marine sediment metagenome]|uniref:Uncharacterized protein n=1 Tax=marine sediment metagenome TaxID=412755 RepID=A0A0F9R2Y3_9ZZZZ
MNNKVKSIFLFIIGLYFLYLSPILVLSVLANISNTVLSITTNTPSFYLNMLAGAWWWIAILIAGVGVYLIKIGHRSLVKKQDRNKN